MQASELPGTCTTLFNHHGFRQHVPIKFFQKFPSTFCILIFPKEIWDHFVMFNRIGN